MDLPFLRDAAGNNI